MPAFRRPRAPLARAATVALFLVMSAGVPATAQQALPGSLGESLNLGDDLTGGRDTYLGGLKDLLRHDPNLNETATPLRLGDLDKDAPDPFVPPAGRVAVAPAARSGADAAAAGGRDERVSRSPSSEIAGLSQHSGTEGLIRDADALLAFREAEPLARSSPDDLRALSSKPGSIYGLGQISPSMPSFGREPSASMATSTALLAIANIGVRNPNLQVRMTVPDFGDGLGSGGNSARNSYGGVSPSRHAGGDTYGSVGKQSLAAWVKSTVVTAARQPLLYVVALGLLGLVVVVGLRRTT